MAKYRYGLYENFFGDQWYQVQVKRFGIWWDDESFSTEKGMMKYVEQLRKQGHILKKHEGNAYYKDEPKRFEEVGLA
jgi:hypothetical protein